LVGNDWKEKARWIHQKTETGKEEGSRVFLKKWQTQADDGD